MLRRVIPYMQTGVGFPYVFPLDAFGNAEIAYSVRKLRSAYTGFCIEVERDSDSTLQDIGFDANGYIDVAAMDTFSGGTDTLYINKIYDQTGNGKHATKIASDPAGQRPYIMLSGVLRTLNGLATFDFKSTSRMEFTSTTPISVFLVYQRLNPRAAEYIIGTTGAAGVITGGTAGGVTGFGYVTSSTVRVQNTVEDLNDHQSTFIGGSTETVWTDGANNVTAGTSFSEVALNTLGRRDQLTTCFEGLESEIIMYTTDKASDRTGMEANQKLYFGTP